MPVNPIDTLEKFGAAYLRVVDLLRTDPDAQWQAGRTPVPREDTTERSKGMTSDPVPAVTLDTRRLALRAATIEAEETLRKAGIALQAVEHHLTTAHERWQG